MLERYALPRMRAIWEPENRYRKWLEVEILVCEALEQRGEIPAGTAAKIRSGAQIDVERILEIEKEVRHDVIAFTTAVGETVGEESKYIHYGLTSYDVVDTALSALMVEAADIIIEDIEALNRVLAKRALEFKDTVTIGRTHGVHAEPTTFGLKLALWWREMERNLDRMRRAREVMAVGRVAGAVGTYANVNPFVEDYVCEKMGLEPVGISTQVLQRDRHAEYLGVLALVATTLDKIATEVRHLQRTEVREVQESFRKGQKGSSAMPHKRNPIVCERLSGQARVIRNNLGAALENINLWHERDISNSSVERVIIPDSTVLMDYMLNKAIDLVENLQVYPEQMKRNLELTGGLIFSQRVLLALVEKGMSREDAYSVVQELAMKAWDDIQSLGTGKAPTFRDLMEGDNRILAVLSGEELAQCFDYSHHLRNVDEIYRRIGLM